MLRKKQEEIRDLDILNDFLAQRFGKGTKKFLAHTKALVQAPIPLLMPFYGSAVQIKNTVVVPLTHYNLTQNTKIPIKLPVIFFYFYSSRTAVHTNVMNTFLFIRIIRLHLHIPLNFWSLETEWDVVKFKNKGYFHREMTKKMDNWEIWAISTTFVIHFMNTYKDTQYHRIHSYFDSLHFSIINTFLRY